MNNNLIELIVVCFLFLISSRIAYVRARRRPPKGGGETGGPRPWAIRDYVLTLVSAATMLIFLVLYLWLAYREVFGLGVAIPPGLGQSLFISKDVPEWRTPWFGLRLRSEFAVFCVTRASCAAQAIFSSGRKS
jgi:hypothetical protein